MVPFGPIRTNSGDCVLQKFWVFQAGEHDAARGGRDP